MQMKNKYRLRPAYGKTELLLEFTYGPEKETFLAELQKALEELEVKIQSAQDLWMNDEVLLVLDSNQGSFTLSIDIWDLAFIMAEHNQGLILKIDELLSQNHYFEKEIVDYEKYKLDDKDSDIE